MMLHRVQQFPPLKERRQKFGNDSAWGDWGVESMTAPEVKRRWLQPGVEAASTVSGMHHTLACVIARVVVR